MNEKEMLYAAVALGSLAFSFFMLSIAWKREMAKTPTQRAVEKRKILIGQRAFRMHQHKMERLYGGITP